MTAAAFPTDAYGGFRARLIATVVDAFIIGLVAGALWALLDLGTRTAGLLGSDRPVTVPLSVVFSLVLGGLYFTYFHSTAAGQSIGNLLVGVRVVDAETCGALLRRRAAARYVLATLSLPFAPLTVGLFLPAPFAVLTLGYLWMLIDPRRQTWHDKIANTLVVKVGALPTPARFGRPSS